MTNDRLSLEGVTFESFENFCFWFQMMHLTHLEMFQKQVVCSAGSCVTGNEFQWNGENICIKIMSVFLICKINYEKKL